MKILITQLGTIGDMILLTPAIRAIIEKYPDASINVIAGKRNWEVLRTNPIISKIYIYNKSPLTLIRLFLENINAGYDYYIDPKDHYSREGTLLARISRAKEKIGFNQPGKVKKAFGNSLAGADENKEQHFIERVFNALTFIGIAKPQKITRPELFVDIGNDTAFLNFLEAEKIKDFVLINTSAGRQNRILPAEKWVKLIRFISESDNVILIHSSDDSKRAASILSESGSERCRIYPTSSIIDVFSVVRCSKLVISPDTSVVHIASAFDKPLIGLYGVNESNNKKFAPLSTHHRIIQPADGTDDISSITPKDIIEAFLGFISKLY